MFPNKFRITTGTTKDSAYHGGMNRIGFLQILCLNVKFLLQEVSSVIKCSERDSPLLLVLRRMDMGVPTVGQGILRLINK
jgi:hypothetical protein